MRRGDAVDDEVEAAALRRHMSGVPGDPIHRHPGALRRRLFSEVVNNTQRPSPGDFTAMWPSAQADHADLLPGPTFQCPSESLMPAIARRHRANFPVCEFQHILFIDAIGSSNPGCSRPQRGPL